jgi:hypothetical protein
MNATALYISDERDTCECCGKTGLKRVVVMRLEDLSLAYWGTTCASRNSGKDRIQINQEIKDARQARQDEAYEYLKTTKAYKDHCEKRIELYAKSKGKWPREWWDKAIAPYVDALEIEKQHIAEHYRINVWEI